MNTLGLAVDAIFFRRIGMKARLQIIVIALLAIASMLGAQTVSNQYKHINVTWVESYQACNFTAPTPINTACINGYQITFTPPSGAGANASTVPACTATVTTNCAGPGNSYSWTPGGFLYAGTWGVSIILQYLDNNGVQQQLSGVATSVVVPLPFVAPSPITGLSAVPAP